MGFCSSFFESTLELENFGDLINLFVSRAFVTIADINEELGAMLAKELGG